MSDGPVITIRRACELLNCKRSRAFELLGAGKLTRAPKFGRETTVTLESVMLLLGVVEVVPEKKRVRPVRSARAAAMAESVLAMPYTGSRGCCS